MVAKIPIRTVYTGSAATGLAEFQSGEFIDYPVGGTGQTTLGTANQILATNAGATAIVWADPTTGYVTGVTAGNGLSGGGTSGTVTVSIDTTITADLTTAQTFTNKTLTSPTISGGTVSVTQVDITAQGDLRLQDTTGGQYVALQAPGTVSTSWTATLPGAVGTSGQALRTSDGSGTLEWFTPETGDITGVTAGTGLSGGGTSGVVTLDVDAAQTQITSLGTIGTGTWQGTAVANAYVADDLTISGGTVNNSVIGGSTAAAGTFTQVDVEATGDLRLQDTTGGEYVALQAPGTVTSYTVTMPGAVGSSGQALRTSNGSGTLEWFTPEVGDITGVTAGDGLTGGGTSGTVTLDVAGTTDRISVSANAIDIASAYVGQNTITTLGTIGTGTWQGTVVADAYVANDLTIASGTVNNTVIGGAQPAAGSFTQIDVVTQGDLRLQDTTGGQYVALQAPGTVSTSWTATFPGAVGSAGQALRTSNASGTLEWFTPEVGDITGVTAGDGLTGGGTSGTVTLDVVGGTGIDVNANDIAIDSTVTTLVGSQTLTNKTLTSPVLNGSLSGTAFLDEDNMSSDSAVAIASQQSIKAYVDAVSSGLDLKESSHAATTANLSSAYNNGSSGVGATLTNNSTQAALTVDGQLMVAAERLLVKDQTAGLQNGIYTVTTVGDGSTNWVLTRATDFDGSPSNEVDSGAFTFVETGTVNADSGWVVTTDGTITIGTTAISFSQFSGAGQITAGAGMTKSGNTLNVIGTANKITVSANAVTIATTYVGQNTITTLGTITTGTWNGTAIANANLANSTMAVGGVTLTLGGTDATPAFNLSDGTAYPGDTSLVTVGTIGTGTWQGTAIADGYLGTSINANKLADGSVSNAELQYINSLSSNAQTQLDTKATKGFSIAMGVALG